MKSAGTRKIAKALEVACDRRFCTCTRSRSTVPLDDIRYNDFRHRRRRYGRGLLQPDTAIAHATIARHNATGRRIPSTMHAIALRISARRIDLREREIEGPKKTESISPNAPHCPRLRVTTLLVNGDHQDYRAMNALRILCKPTSIVPSPKPILKVRGHVIRALNRTPPAAHFTRMA